MSAILKVAVSQRVDVWADRGERRDALDQRLCRWLMAAGCIPMPVPNALNQGYPLGVLSPPTGRGRAREWVECDDSIPFYSHPSLPPARGRGQFCANELSGLNSHSVAERGENCSGLQNWLLAVKPDAVLLSGGNDIGEVSERDNTERRLLDYARDSALPALGICRGMQMMAVWAGGSLSPVSGHVRTRHRLQAANPGEWPDEVNSFHNFALADCPLGFVVAARVKDGTIEAIRHETLPWEGWMWHPEREPQFNPTDLMRFRTLLDSRSTI